MIENDAIVSLQVVFRCFDELGLRYYIGGSLASTAHGKGRMTQDADVVCDMNSSHVTSVVGALDADFYVSESAAKSAVKHASCFNAIHKTNFFKVDIFVASDDAYSRQAMERREEKAFRVGEDDCTFFVATAEDTILAKLRWYRLGNEVSQTQWSDIIGVIGVKRELLDWEYLHQWAGELGVADLLQRADDAAA